MALKIRLRRMGRKKAPTYRIVVAETTMPRDGRFVASIGHYNPRTEPLTLQVDRDRALFWLDQGAIPTDTAKSLLKRAGVFGPAPTATEEADIRATHPTRSSDYAGARPLSIANPRLRGCGPGGALARAIPGYEVREQQLAMADTIAQAIARERAVKHWPRAWKVALIESVNPNWEDLYDILL